MALIACRECGKEISEYAKACPHCGIVNEPKKEKRPTTTLTKILSVPIVLVFLFFMYGLFASRSPEFQERMRAQEDVEYCWKSFASSQSRSQSNDAGDRLSLFSMCKALETQFREKYGREP